MRMTIWRAIPGILFSFLFVSCTINNEDSPTSSGTEPVPPDSSQLVIVGAQYAGPPIIPFSSSGDIWMSTWADDDNLYMSWGGGAGPAQPTSNPVFQTDAGVAMFIGDVPDFINISSPFECVRSIFVPDGTSGAIRNDKPSSLLFLDGVLYFAGHTPEGDVDFGYIAYSEDYGLSWTEVSDSPWTRENDSPFRNLMFINMGCNYDLNVDGYVYAFGIGHEWAWTDGSIRLCRVSKGSIINYEDYRYFAGMDSVENPTWSEDQTDAVPVETLIAHAQASCMFHYGSQHYLFLAKENLFASTSPWGPWYKVRYYANEYYDSWDGGYMPGIISKDAGDDYFYFTLAGQDSIISYGCHLGKIELDLAEIIP